MWGGGGGGGSGLNVNWFRGLPGISKCGETSRGGEGEREKQESQLLF